MSERKTRPEAKAARRIVVKVGSGVLTRAGTLRPGVVTRLAAEVAALLDAVRQVVVVPSGAIAMGSRILGSGTTRAARSRRSRPPRRSARSRSRSCGGSACAATDARPRRCW